MPVSRKTSTFAFDNLKKGIKMTTKKTMTKKEIAFEERMAKQRAKRGYSDRDTWSIDYWFCNTISPMLKQLAKNTHGYQTLDENGDIIYTGNTPKEESEMYAKRWKDTILHMAFLADEMNEETCSVKNPMEKKHDRIWRAFGKKYGMLGEKLQTDEEKKQAEEGKGIRAYFPEDDPVHGEEYRKITDQYMDFEKKISDYREECKNEFFKLFSMYFWYLWD